MVFSPRGREADDGPPNARDGHRADAELAEGARGPARQGARAARGRARGPPQVHRGGHEGDRGQALKSGIMGDVKIGSMGSRWDPHNITICS